MNRGVFLPLQQELSDPDLVRRFLSQVMAGDGRMQLDKSFGKFCQQHGWANFTAELTSVIETTTSATINRNAEMFATLCLAINGYFFRTFQRTFAWRIDTRHV